MPKRIYIYYHVHTDGILEGWIDEKTGKPKCCSNQYLDCRVYRNKTEAKNYLIARWKSDISFLRANIRKLKKS